MTDGASYPFKSLTAMRAFQPSQTIDAHFGRSAAQVFGLTGRAKTEDDTAPQQGPIYLVSRPLVRQSPKSPPGCRPKTRKTLYLIVG
jgi:hypothetical protein